MCIPSADGVSATCTAPPASSAPPAAVADNFAKAIFTDMSKLSRYFSRDGSGNGDSAIRHFPVTATEANTPYPAIVLTIKNGSGTN